MSFTRNPKTKVYEATVEDRSAGRVHLSLRTKNAREAGRRHAAFEALMRQAGHGPAAEVLRRLRRRKLTIEAVTACFEAGRPFDSLLATQAWPTLDTACDDYLAWLRTHPDRAEGTYLMAASRLKALRAALGGDRPVDTILTADVEAMRQALVGRFTDGTVHQYLIRLGALYAWLQKREDRRAVEEQRPPRALHSPVDREMLPPASALRGTRTRFLSEDEAARVMAATPASLAAAVGLMLLAGLRIEEACHLEPGDLDFELGLVYVRPKPSPDVPASKGGVWKPKTPASVREVPIEPQLGPVLRRHLARWASPRWLLPSATRPDWPNSRDRIGEHFERVVGDAGLVYGRDEPDGITPHTLRHTFASWLVMEGVDLFTVAKLLGHSDTKEVEETYGHLSPQHKAQAVAKLGNRFRLPAAVTEGTEVTPVTPEVTTDGPAAAGPSQPSGANPSQLAAQETA